MLEKAKTKHVQTRRSISVPAETYDKLNAHCEVRGISKSSVVEKVVNEFFDRKANQ